VVSRKRLKGLDPRKAREPAPALHLLASKAAGSLALCFRSHEDSWENIECPLLLERTIGRFRLDVEHLLGCSRCSSPSLIWHCPLPAARNFPALLQGLARTNC
jgi:hypothetical protein